MKSLLILLISIIVGRADGFYLTFCEPTNAAKAAVQHYDAWWQATNEANPQEWHWIGSCKIGFTNIALAGVGTVLPNPCFLAATSTGGLGPLVDSAKSASILFDTNIFPPPATLLLPPSILGIQRK